MSTEKIDKNTVTKIDNWSFEKGKEIPEDFNYGGVQNAGKVLKVDTDGFIRLLNGGGSGGSYTAGNGINISSSNVISVDTSTGINNAKMTGTTNAENIVVSGDLTTANGAFVDFTGASIDFSNSVMVNLGNGCNVSDTGTSLINLPAYMTINGIEYKTPTVDGLISKTWSQLKAMRDNGTLVAGAYYRITDYVATTTQTNTQTANHPFDLIVVAIANNKLSEEATAIQHSGDTYFANSNLTSWDVWYCLDNDTNRFAWADSVNGKGVIYYLQDEFSNSCWYDWKGIQVKNTNSSDRFYYLFDNEGVDSSLSPATSFPSVYGNKLGFYIYSNKFQIGCNVFKGSSFRNTTIGNNFSSNTIGNYFSNTTIGNNFYNNTIGNYFSNNTIGNSFYSNTIGNYFSNNTIGNNFYNNNTTSQTTQPKYCSFPDGVESKITTSTTLTRLSKTTFYLGSDGTLKTLD